MVVVGVGNLTPDGRGGGEFDRLDSISCYTLRGFFHNTCNGSSKGQADESQEYGKEYIDTSTGYFNL